MGHTYQKILFLLQKIPKNVKILIQEMFWNSKCSKSGSTIKKQKFFWNCKYDFECLIIILLLILFLFHTIFTNIIKFPLTGNENFFGNCIIFLA